MSVELGLQGTYLGSAKDRYLPQLPAPLEAASSSYNNLSTRTIWQPIVAAPMDPSGRSTSVANINSIHCVRCFVEAHLKRVRGRERCAVAVGGSVQLELARRLKAVRGRGGGPGGRLLGRSRGVVVMVVLRNGSDRGRRLVVVVGRSRGRSGGRSRVLVLAEAGVVPARVVLAVVVVAAAAIVLLGRGGIRLLRLVVGLRGRLWRGCGGYRQMVSGGLEAAKADGRGRNISISHGQFREIIHPAVDLTHSCRQLGAILLRVGGAELAVAGLVPLLAEDGGGLRVAVVPAVVLGGRGHQQR
uniref:Uncharacterized protein n=1 Tax=Anopheles atroparvus TaxID=41427 RepID=A0A182IXV4_ANOAO